MAPGPQESPASIGSQADSAADPPVHTYAKRRNFFIKKWMQSRYIIYYLAIMCSSSFVLFILVQRSAHKTLALEMQQGHSIIFDTWTILRPEMVRANIIVIFAAITVAALTTLSVTWTVRRAAETLTSNVHTYMNGSRTEQWSAIRHPREFQHLQVLLGKALSEYQGRIAHLRQEVAGFAEIAREARESAGPEGAPSGREAGDLRAGFVRVRDCFDKIGEEERNED